MALCPNVAPVSDEPRYRAAIAAKNWKQKFSKEDALITWSVVIIYDNTNVRIAKNRKLGHEIDISADLISF